MKSFKESLQWANAVASALGDMEQLEAGRDQRFGVDMGRDPSLPRPTVGVQWSDGEWNPFYWASSRPDIAWLQERDLLRPDVPVAIELAGPGLALVGATGAGSTRADPMHPGVSISHEKLKTSGTLGAFVKVDGREEAYALSNNHVLAHHNGTLGDSIIQPGTSDRGDPRSDRIGELTFCHPLTPSGNEIDAALSSTEGREIRTSIPHIGPVQGMSGPAPLQEIEKVGKATGHRSGTVDSLIRFAVVAFPDGTLRSFRDVWGVRDGSDAFSAAGDSGSLIVTTESKEAVGLLFARYESKQRSVFCSILKVKTQLGISSIL